MELNITNDRPKIYCDNQYAIRLKKKKKKQKKRIQLFWDRHVEVEYNYVHDNGDKDEVIISRLGRRNSFHFIRVLQEANRTADGLAEDDFIRVLLLSYILLLCCSF